MKSTRLSGRVHAMLFAATLALFLLPARVPAATATAASSLVESKLAGSTILNSPVQNLLTAVGDAVKQNPSQAAAIVSAVLSAGRTDTDAIAPRVTVAAITALGPKPPGDAVKAIVTASIKAAPAVVLETVRSSVQASPSSADAIVDAAVRAVPDPHAKVPMIADQPPPAVRGYAKDESKDLPSPIATEDNPQVLPIAEGIAQAAELGDPSLSYQDLLTTANNAVSSSTGGGPGGTGGGFSVTSYNPVSYYPPIVGSRGARIPNGLPGLPVVSP